jgi:hypothetical protein
MDIDENQIKEIFKSLDYLREPGVMLRLRCSQNDMALSVQERMAITEFMDNKNEKMLIDVVRENQKPSRFFMFWLSQLLADKLEKNTNRIKADRDLWIFMAIDFAQRSCGFSLTHDDLLVFELMAKHMQEKKHDAIHKAYYRGKVIFDSFPDKTKAQNFFQPLKNKFLLNLPRLT